MQKLRVCGCLEESFIEQKRATPSGPSRADLKLRMHWFHPRTVDSYCVKLLRVCANRGDHLTHVIVFNSFSLNRSFRSFLVDSERWRRCPYVSCSWDQVGWINLDWIWRNGGLLCFTMLVIVMPWEFGVRTLYDGIWCQIFARFMACFIGTNPTNAAYRKDKC